MRKGDNIYKRKDGRWEARYKNGYKKDGSTKYSSVYGKTYTEVKEKRENIIKNLNKPKLKQNKIILNELFEMYIENIRFSVKYSTLSHYIGLYHSQVAPCLGGLKIVCIDSDMINNFISSKLEVLSSKYVNDILVLLLSVLEFGKEKQLIDTIFKIKKIKTKGKKIEVFNEEERERLEKYLFYNNNLVHIGILLSRFCGLRIGEICALRLYDFDFRKGMVKINKTMQRVKNLDKKASTRTKIIEDTPKSEKSIRSIPIPLFLVRLIDNLTRGLNRNCYLLTGSVNHFIEPRSLEYRYKRVLKECRIKYKNFHVLRHTFATECVEKNYFDYKTLSEILGHSSVKITLDRYVHSNMVLKVQGIEKIERDFLNRQNHCQNLIENCI